jgi:hypothetical protein
MRFLCLATFVLTALAGTLVAGATLHVSTEGNDAWSGSQTEPQRGGTDGPLASLEGARNRIRELRKIGANEEMRVFIRGGVYWMSKPLILEPQDSGTFEHPVTYSAYRDEKPVFNGGRKIGGWQRQSDGRWTAKIEEGVPYFLQLFVNGERRIRARTPNEGFLQIQGMVTEDRNDPANNRGFRFAPGDIEDWQDPEVNIIAIHSWETSRHRIASVDLENNVVQFTGPAYWPFTQWDPRQRYFIENLREGLDAPGEWYLDRAAGELSYIPLAGEDMSKAEVIAPVAEKFVVFAGDAASGQHVKHITLSGLSFQYSSWELKPEGHSDAQAANSVPAVIEMNAARLCAIEKCEIAHIGTYGIRVNRGSHDIRIEQNHIHDMGAGGICIGEKAIDADPQLAVARVNVHNNYIHDGGHVYESAVGVWIGQSSDNTIAHNEISDLGYTGVSVGWTWGYGESGAQRNIVEYNHIHHIGYGNLSDMGAIYTLGVSPGSALRNNYIHHILSYHYGGWGLYHDEGSSHYLDENNVVHDTKTGGFHQHYGKENFLRNNIFMNSLNEQVIRSRVEDHRSFRFERNIVYYTTGDLLGSNWKGTNFHLDHNVYWNAGGEPVEFQGLTLEEWRKEKNMDWNSVVADPMFRDPAKNDFRLKENSPALAMGFEEIDMSRTGLIGAREWRELPNRYTKHRQVWPEPPKPETHRVRMEDLEPGAKLPFGTTYGETGGASVRVSADRASSGQHSLKFTDAPDLDHAFNPHFFFDPGYMRGRAIATFDLWLGPGADFYHEWRTEGGNYIAGPSIKISPEGELTANGQKVMDVPREKWMQIQIICGLGAKADGIYDLSVSVDGEPQKRFENLAIDPKFRKLRWWGLCSMATSEAVLYVDNLSLQAND